MTTFAPIRAPIYRQVKAQMLERLGREWTAGTRLPPVKELATQFDAGERAVLQAVQELAAEGWLESRQRRGTFVRERTQRFNLAIAPGQMQARDATVVRKALAGKTVSLVASLPPSDGFILEIVDGFAGGINEAGAAVNTISVHATAPMWRASHVDVTHFGGDAICLINPPTNVMFSCDPRKKLLLITTVPERRVDMVGGFDIVSVDHHHGAYLAGRRLRELGCTDVCYLGMRDLQKNTQPFDATSTERLDGLEAGLGARLPADHHLVCMYYSYDNAAAVVPQFMALQPRPQGVFAASDELAIGFVTGAAAHGLKPGVDYQIIGFDGQIAGRHLQGGPLSTIDVHPRRMGVTGAELLIERFEQPEIQPRRVLLGCTLIEGRTAVSSKIAN